MRTLILIVLVSQIAACPWGDLGGAVADAGVDGNADAAEVVPPLRTFTSRRLFGGMPLDNRFLDPQFALLDGVGWGAANDTSLVRLLRNFPARTPLDQPALQVPKGAPMPGLMLWAQVKGGVGPQRLLVWVGRPAEVGDVDQRQVSMGLFGLYADGQEGMAEGAMDTTREPLILDGIVWRLFAAEIDDGPVGWALFLVVDDALEDLYLSSPMLVAADTELTFGGARVGQLPSAKVRPATAAELRAAARWRAARERPAGRSASMRDPR